MARTARRPSQGPRRRIKSETEREAHRQIVERDGGWYLHAKRERERREAEQSERDSKVGR